MKFYGFWTTLASSTTLKRIHPWLVLFTLTTENRKIFFWGAVRFVSSLSNAMAVAVVVVAAKAKAKINDQQFLNMVQPDESLGRSCFEQVGGTFVRL